MISPGGGSIFEGMKERVIYLLVFSLLFSGVASPCACMDCSCETVESVQAEESHSCCQATKVESSSCCHESAKTEAQSCCGQGHCDCDHTEMGCNCGEKSKEAEPVAPQPTSETSSNIQLVAFLPMTVLFGLEDCLSIAASEFETQTRFYSDIPIYLSTHSILC